MKRFTWCVLAFCLSSYTSAFSPLPETLVPFDIFDNDASTRKEAVAEDLRWTVNVSGCSGSMLSPTYVLSAHHCGMRKGQKLTSGGCLLLGCKDDLTVVRIVEQYSDFDSDIAEVTWSRKDSRWKQRYSPRVQTSADELTLGKDSTATKLFTVGFPGDKKVPTIAEGFAKSRSGNFLNYNIGTINGNSGGAVWKADDFTLVSQTNHGPHALGQPGWNGNDPEDSNAWNGGPQIDLLYKKSKTLQTVYPDGENLNVSFEGYLIYDSVLPEEDSP